MVIYVVLTDTIVISIRIFSFKKENNNNTNTNNNRLDLFTLTFYKGGYQYAMGNLNE